MEFKEKLETTQGERDQLRGQIDDILNSARLRNGLIFVH